MRGSRVPDSPAVTVSTVEGGQVELPCDITSGPGQDSVYLVLWYRKVCQYISISSSDNKPGTNLLFSSPD